MAASYKSFVKEAYIDPIRSVLIIDDDYPTLEELLFMQVHKDDEHSAQIVDQKGKYSEKAWRSTPLPVKSVIDQFRNNKWLVDTHDGQNINLADEESFTHHLHQSDLLILDYQLDGDDSGGDKCLSVIRHLAANNHHNLVVVYTNEEPEKVFRQIVLRLLCPCAKIEEKVQGNTAVNDAVSDWECEDDEIASKIIDSIDLGLYLAVRKDYQSCMREINSADGVRFHQFVSLFDQRPSSMTVNKNGSSAKSVGAREVFALPESLKWPEIRMAYK